MMYNGRVAIQHRIPIKQMSKPKLKRGITVRINISESDEPTTTVKLKARCTASYALLDDLRHVCGQNMEDKCNVATVLVRCIRATEKLKEMHGPQLEAFPPETQEYLLSQIEKWHKSAWIEVELGELNKPKEGRTLN